MCTQLVQQMRECDRSCFWCQIFITDIRPDLFLKTSHTTSMTMKYRQKQRKRKKQTNESRLISGAYAVCTMHTKDKLQ